MPKLKQAMPKETITRKTIKKNSQLKSAPKKKPKSADLKKNKSIEIPEEFIIKDYHLVKPRTIFDFSKLANKLKFILDIKKIALRCLVVLLIIGINLSGASLVAQAFFADFEITPEAGLTIASLDLDLRSDSQNFVPTSTAVNLMPGSQVIRNIYLSKNGTADFKYQASSSLINGDANLYNSLFLNIWYNWYDDLPAPPDYQDHKNRDLKYSGLLSAFTDFDTRPDLDLQIENSKTYYPNPFYNQKEHWLEFQITLPVSASSDLQNSSIEFEFNFYVQQLASSGFNDQEGIVNNLTTAHWGVVLNEFIPNPNGSDAGEPGPPLDGEWVELYNNGNQAVDVAGWVIYDQHDSNELYITAQNTNTGSTVIPAQGWLVIYRDGDGDFSLNNDGDSVRLYDGYPPANSNLIDAYTYTQGKAEGSSFARIPDGTGSWVDPVPTPGGTNTTFENLTLLNQAKEKDEAAAQPANIFDAQNPTAFENFNNQPASLAAENLATTTPTTSLLDRSNLNDVNFGSSTSTPTTTFSGIQCYTEDAQGNLILEKSEINNPSGFLNSTSTPTSTIEIIQNQSGEFTLNEELELNINAQVSEEAGDIKDNENAENIEDSKQDIQQQRLKQEEILTSGEQEEQIPPNDLDEPDQQQIKPENGRDELPEEGNPEKI